MKRVIAILLAAALLLAMTACVGKTESTAESGSPESSSSAAEKAEASKAETESAEPEGSSSQEEAAKPAKEEPKKERWVCVWMEQPVTELMAQLFHSLTPGDPYMDTSYAYNEKGDVIRRVETFYDDYRSKTESSELRYNERGDLVYSYTTTDSTTGVIYGSSPGTFEYTYDNTGNIIRKIHRSDGVVDKVTLYEYDGQGRETKRTEAVSLSDAESGARDVTVTEYGEKFRSKVTESRYDSDGVLFVEQCSLYDEYGSVINVEHTVGTSEDLSLLGVDFVYERDSRGNILKTTKTFRKGTVQVIEESYDENDHVISYKDMVTDSAGETGVVEWWTREYEEDGHSYTQKARVLYDDAAGTGAKAGDVSYITYYKYLPLSEAIAQQDLSGEVTIESAPEPSEAEVYVSENGSTITKIGDGGTQGTWALFIQKGDRVYEDTLTFEVKTYINSQSGQFNGYYEWTGEDSLKLTFNQSEATFALGPEYGQMEFVRQ